MSFYIMDWAGNHLFRGQTWKTFEDAEEFLCEFFESEGLDYEEERGEHEIMQGTPKVRYNYTQNLA